MSRPFQRFCKQGHDTFEARGRTTSGACRLCANAFRAKYRAKDPAKARAQLRLHNRRKAGMLSPTDETRSGPCEICGRDCKKLHLDHDHATGRIRGWLCPKCNTRLECIENEEWKQQAEQYLQKRKNYSGA